MPCQKPDCENSVLDLATQRTLELRECWVAVNHSRAQSHSHPALAGWPNEPNNLLNRFNGFSLTALGNR